MEGNMKKVLICLFILSFVTGIAYGAGQPKKKPVPIRVPQVEGVRTPEVKDYVPIHNYWLPHKLNEYSASVDGMSVIVRVSKDNDGLHLNYFRDDNTRQFLGEEIFVDGLKVYDSFMANDGALGWIGDYYNRFKYY
jgi:hypothetical protein